MTENTVQPNANESKHEIVARPVGSWDIKTAEGKILYLLRVDEIGKGLREGWLKLEDMTRHDESTEWQTIREKLGRGNFAIEVFVNTPRAFAWRFALWGIMGVFVPGFIVATLDATAVPIDPYSILPAALQPEFVAVALRDALIVVVMGFIIGGGLGYVIGRITGSALKNNYKLPVNRIAVPEWVKLTLEIPTPLNENGEAISLDELHDHYTKMDKQKRKAYLKSMINQVVNWQGCAKIDTKENLLYLNVPHSELGKVKLRGALGFAKGVEQGANIHFTGTITEATCILGIMDIQLDGVNILEIEPR